MRDLKTIGQALDSREVAKMVGKSHSELLKDIRRYIGQFTEGALSYDEFFQENKYTDARGAARPCYQITRKGCEFIAHKLTGTKGTVFTFKYINSFCLMQDYLLHSENKPDLPWFIRKFRGSYIVLERDFITITGVDIRKHQLFYSVEHFKSGLDFNSWGWKCDNETFLKTYGFEYGAGPSMTYFYPRGVLKALALLSNDSRTEMIHGSYKIFMDGLKMLTF